jgi:NADPH:quinone reductase-like Zn-dependent oxidoreductase
MRALVIEEAGPEGRVVLRGGVQVAPLYRRAVRVQVVAAGVNRADVLQRRGLYPAPAGAPPDIPGLEFAGWVEAVAEGCARAQVGDRVMGIVPGGAQAEFLVIHEDELLPIPSHLSFEEAAALPEALATAFDALDLQAGLRAGESVLVTAAGSGVGVAALQLARLAGAQTIGTSRTLDKLERAQAGWGLQHPLRAPNPNTPEELEALIAQVMALTEGRGVDVVLDFMGGRMLDAHTRLLAPGGRLVTLGLLQGARGQLDLSVVMAKRLRLMGSTLRSRPHAERVRLLDALRARALYALRRQGHQPAPLRPCLDQVLPFDDAAAAYARIEQGDTFGKLVLSWGAG